MSDEGQDEKLEDSGSPEAGDSTEGSPTEAELRQEAAENWNRYLRTAAELENLRKRASREVENARKYGVERLAQAILPVRDSIEAGLSALDGDGNVDVDAIREGEQATLRLLDQVLEASGIREIDPRGEPFDPTQHEAMSVYVSADAAPDSVLEVVQKGYSLHERILRPARVIVAKAPEGN